MDHPPQVDTQQPFPVLHRVFPHQPASTDPSVIEYKVRCAKLGCHGLGQFFHLFGIGHIDPLGHDAHAHGLHLVMGGFEGVFLHIRQHQVHAKGSANAGAFQAKAGRATG